MILGQIREFEQRHIWERDYRDAPYWQRAGVRSVRVSILLYRDLVEGELSLRAMSLVYTTLLSMVPLLALSFSILKGFGVQNRLEHTLETALAPLGDEKATQLTENLIGFVNNMNVSVLGAVGLAFLIFTVVSLMQKVESSFNYVWRISTPRTFGERFATFLSAITIGPLLLFAAIGATGSVVNTALMSRVHDIPVVGGSIDLVVRLLPFALVISAFTFLYAFIPNARVRLSAALTGGVIAGLLWESLSLGFASYATGASSYQLVYATFATAIFFMIWLYLNWLILLIGASISFYSQHPEIVATGLKEVRFSAALTARYALSLLARIGKRFYERGEPYTLDELAEEYDVPRHALAQCLEILVTTRILAETDDPIPRLVPGVPFDATRVSEVLALLETFRPAQTYAPPPIDEPRIARVLEIDAQGRADALGSLTLKQVALGEVGGPSKLE